MSSSLRLHAAYSMLALFALGWAAENDGPVKILRTVEKAIQNDDVAGFQHQLSSRSLDILLRNGPGEVPAYARLFMALLRHEIPLKIVDLRVQGAQAQLNAEGARGESFDLRMVKEHGRWKLDITSELRDWQAVVEHVRDFTRELERKHPLLGAKGPKQQPFASVAEPKRDADQPGAASPRELVHKYLTALAQGDARKLAACFDQSDAFGKAAVELHQQIAQLVTRVRQLQQAANDKFGEDGVQAVREKLRIHAGPVDVQRLEDYVAREVIVFEKSGVDSAFAVLEEFDDVFWRLRRKNDRWYIAMSKHEVQVVALFGGLVSTGQQKQVERAIELVKVSTTTDGFAANLEELRTEIQPDKLFDKQVP